MPKSLLAVLVALLLVSCGPPPPPIAYSPVTGHLDFSPYGGGDYLRGINRLKNNEFEAALRALGPPAADCDEAAQFEVGMMVLDGQGIEKNPEEGIYWLTRSASDGHETAQFELGLSLIHI